MSSMAGTCPPTGSALESRIHLGDTPQEEYAPDHEQCLHDPGNAIEQHRSPRGYDYGHAAMPDDKVSNR